MLILVCLQKKFKRFPNYQGDKAQFLTHGCKFVMVRKILLSALWQGSLVLKPSLYPALLLSVSQKHQLTMKARMEKISVDVAVAINHCSLRKSTSMAQVFKTVEFSIDFIRRS